jgi:hypothetical protein
MEKKNHVHFYSSSHKTCGILDLIHYDMFSLVDVSFIDDYSRIKWVFFKE